jgi:Zinc knuckle
MPQDRVVEIKGLKVEPPEQYDGKDDLIAWERWFDSLLTYFYLNRVVGPELDSQRVLLTGTRLTGNAATWFAQEITGASRAKKRWNFEDVICALFRRFLTEITAQKAVDAFYQVRYSRAKGALGFWNELVQASERMLNPPDRGTLKRQFLNGLPQDIVEATLKSRSINIELASPDEIIEAIRQMEATLHYISHRRRPDGSSSSSTNTGVHKAQAERSRPFTGQRFVRLRPAWRGDEKGGPSSRPSFDKGARKAPGETKSFPVRRPTPKEGVKPADKSKVTCYGCGIQGHYANECPKGSGKPLGKARNYALHVEEEEAIEGEVVEQGESNSPNGDEQADEEDGYAGGDQYDPDEIFVLEDLEEDPDENVGDERMGAMRVEPEPVYLGSIREANENSLRAVSTRPRVNAEDDPYRAHASKDRAGVRPTVKKEERQCLAAFIELNGVKAYALFDTGSTADLMSPDFARVARVASFKLAENVPLQLGCVGSRSAITRGCRVSGKFGRITIEDVYFDVANIDRYDVIMGTTFMYAHDIVLDIRGREILVGGKNGYAVKAIAPGEEMQLQVERHKSSERR